MCDDLTVLFAVARWQLDVIYGHPRLRCTLTDGLKSQHLCTGLNGYHADVPVITQVATSLEYVTSCRDVDAIIGDDVRLENNHRTS